MAEIRRMFTPEFRNRLDAIISFNSLDRAIILMGIRSRRALIIVPLAVAAAVYLLFVLLLQSDIPHGPIEKLLS